MNIVVFLTKFIKKGGYAIMSTKLLVIDDDSNICEMLRVYFENATGISRT